MCKWIANCPDSGSNHFCEISFTILFSQLGLAFCMGRGGEGGNLASLLRIKQLLKPPSSPLARTDSDIVHGNFTPPQLWLHAAVGWAPRPATAVHLFSSVIIPQLSVMLFLQWKVLPVCPLEILFLSGCLLPACFHVRLQLKWMGMPTIQPSWNSSLCAYLVSLDWKALSPVLGLSIS